MREEFNVVVAVPSKDYWDKKFGLSLCSMVAFVAGNPIPGYKRWNFAVHDADGSILPQSRQRLVEQAIEREATHILFVDSDQTFPCDTLHRLASWHKPIVACNVCTKNPDKPNSTARAKSNRKEGRPQYVVPGEHGLVETWRVGTGVMLIDLSVFRGLEKPWFMITWRKEWQDFQGEDWYFVELMERRGVPVYWDNALSWEIGHRGPVEFRHVLIDIPDGYKFEGQSLMPRECVGLSDDKREHSLVSLTGR